MPKPAAIPGFLQTIPNGMAARATGSLAAVVVLLYRGPAPSSGPAVGTATATPGKARTLEIANSPLPAGASRCGERAPWPTESWVAQATT